MSSRIPIYLYLPNILGYARIFLGFLGLWFAFTLPPLTIALWIISSLLDAIDGILARKLNQCSELGMLLDIIADNIVRSIFWIAAIISSTLYHSQNDDHPNNNEQIWITFIGTFIICLEWMTMLSTQLHASLAEGKHWKEERQKDPSFVKFYFSNNFRNPIGAVGIFGLFGSGIYTYASYIPAISETFPFFCYGRYISYVGRFISMPVELWLCFTYFRAVIDIEEKKKL